MDIYRFFSIEVLIPRVLWAQRKDTVLITLEVFEVKEETIEIKDNTVSFSGIRGTDNAKFAVTLELFGSVDSENSKIVVGHRDVSLVLAKTEVGPFWPRLLKSTQKMHYIHTDFSKWVDEDEEDEEADAGNFGNFDMSQFGGAGSNFDMNQFADDDAEENLSDDEHDEDCSHENCSHSETAKISGLTKNNEALDS